MSRLSTFVSTSEGTACAASSWHVNSLTGSQYTIEEMECGDCGGCLFDDLDRDEVLAKCLD